MRNITIFTTHNIDDLSSYATEHAVYKFEIVDSKLLNKDVRGQRYVFCDWILPDISGLEYVRRARSNPKMAYAHITMILDEDTIEARKRAIHAGADDYILGPVTRADILDRVMLLENPEVTRPNDKKARGMMVIDRVAVRATWQGQTIPLRPNEFSLLCFLSANADRLLTRQEIIDGLGKHEPALDARTVDVWIGRLRRSFEQVGARKMLRTIRSRGYVFDSPQFQDRLKI